MKNIPDVESDGLRRYGQWAGNPAGYKENITRCAYEVWRTVGRTSMAGQCDRPRGHGPDGLYCKQHDPEAERKRREASNKKYEEKRKREFLIPEAERKIAEVSINYFDQKATFDDIEKAVIEYRKLIAD